MEFFLASSQAGEARDAVPFSWRSRWPDTVWIGLVCSAQGDLEDKLADFLSVPTQRKFLVLAPLREAIDLNPRWCRGCMRCEIALSAMGDLGDDGAGNALSCCVCSDYQGVAHKLATRGWCLPYVAWVVVGADQGPDAVPFDEAWVQKIVDACDEEGVPRYVTSIGTRAIVRPGPEAWPVTDPAGADPREWPTAMWWRQWPVIDAPRAPFVAAARAAVPGLVTRDWAARERTELRQAQSSDGADLVTRVCGEREPVSRREVKDRTLVEHVDALLGTVVALYDDNRVWREAVAELQADAEPVPDETDAPSVPAESPDDQTQGPGLYFYVVSSPFYVPVLATGLADAGRAAVTEPLFQDPFVSVLRVVAEAPPGFAMPPNAPLVVTPGFHAACNRRRTRRDRVIGEYTLGDVEKLLAELAQHESRKA